MVTATYDQTGQLTGFYPKQIGYAVVPAPNVDIDDVTHRDAVAHPGKYHVANGAVVAVDPWPPVPTAETIDQTRRLRVLEQIRALEDAQTPRLVREAIVDGTIVNQKTGRTASQQLAWLDGQITALRGQLQ